MLVMLGIATAGIAAVDRTDAGSDGASVDAASAPVRGDGEATAAKPGAAPERVAANQSPQSGPITAGQEEALNMAQNALDHGGFSHSGIIGYLEYWGISHEDAVYAVDAIDPDWNWQAAQGASTMLYTEDLSRSGLIERLEGDGFTHAQAAYGADTALQWAADEGTDPEVADEGTDPDVADEGTDPDVADEGTDPDVADQATDPGVAQEGAIQESTAGP